ncbi:hypothetical protein K466DRAFT_121062 [Polyporus arcularius HHB13444]|uniref:Uncharacterized protein n=1 Tax=Polyporus arcularius HHB13444 TaxID=1314778 RepID=A0A5C3PV15_9APHY|nr:hypothetical protein K466DRAFT_121062 [Polyporus arcularius HHB13444]
MLQAFNFKSSRSSPPPPPLSSLDARLSVTLLHRLHRSFTGVHCSCTRQRGSYKGSLVKQWRGPVALRDTHPELRSVAHIRRTARRGTARPQATRTGLRRHEDVLAYPLDALTCHMRSPRSTRICGTLGRSLSSDSTNSFIHTSGTITQCIPSEVRVTGLGGRRAIWTYVYS